MLEENGQTGPLATSPRMCQVDELSTFSDGLKQALSLCKYICLLHLTGLPESLLKNTVDLMMIYSILGWWDVVNESYPLSEASRQEVYIYIPYLGVWLLLLSTDNEKKGVWCNQHYNLRKCMSKNDESQKHGPSSKIHWKVKDEKEETVWNVDPDASLAITSLHTDMFPNDCYRRRACLSTCSCVRKILTWI